MQNDDVGQNLMRSVYIAILLLSLAGCRMPRREYDAPSEPEWLHLSRTVTLDVFQTSFRLNEKVGTPTESWAVKFESLQTEFERLTGSRLPMFLATEIAIREVDGWTAVATLGGSGSMRHVTVLDALRYVCEANGFRMFVTEYGFLITD